MTIDNDVLHLFIDDERTMSPAFNALARTPEKAIEILKKATADGMPIVTIAFDHDMGYDHEKREEITTRPVMQWMIENNVWPIQLFVHSYNQYGAQWLMATAEEHAPEDCYLERVNARDYPQE